MKYLVVDEADKLFNEGFLEQIDPIFAACTNTNLQRCLFSATLDDRVETLAKSVMISPVKITIGAQNAVAESITQQLKFVGNGTCTFHFELQYSFQCGEKPYASFILILIHTAKSGRWRGKKLIHQFARAN